MPYAAAILSDSINCQRPRASSGAPCSLCPAGRPMEGVEGVEGVEGGA